MLKEVSEQIYLDPLYTHIIFSHLHYQRFIKINQFLLTLITFFFSLILQVLSIYYLPLILLSPLRRNQFSSLYLLNELFPLYFHIIMYMFLCIIYINFLSLYLFSLLIIKLYYWYLLVLSFSLKNIRKKFMFNKYIGKNSQNYFIKNNYIIMSF